MSFGNCLWFPFTKTPGKKPVANVSSFFKEEKLSAKCCFYEIPVEESMVCSSRALLSRGLVLPSMEAVGSIHLLRKEPVDLKRSDLCYRQSGLKNTAWHVVRVDWGAVPKQGVRSRAVVGISCL